MKGRFNFNEGSEAPTKKLTSAELDEFIATQFQANEEDTEGLEEVYEEDSNELTTQPSSNKWDLKIDLTDVAPPCYYTHDHYIMGHSAAA